MNKGKATYKQVNKEIDHLPSAKISADMKQQMLYQNAMFHLDEALNACEISSLRDNSFVSQELCKFLDQKLHEALIFTIHNIEISQIIIGEIKTNKVGATVYERHNGIFSIQKVIMGIMHPERSHRRARRKKEVTLKVS